MLRDDGAVVRVGHTLGCFFVNHTYERVGQRNGHTEYACVRCGHTFVQHPEAQTLVRHPIRCVLLGHWIAFVERRGAFSEYACGACGHPFLFRGSAVSSRRSTDRAA